MSKTVSIPLKAEYAKGTTTIARCWRFERRDGEVVTVTTCARDLLINGEVYRSKEGVNPTSIAQEASSAVSNSDVTGTMAAESVSEAELFAGLWDGAFVSVFEVNYRDLSMGTMQLQSGSIGDVKAGRSAFTAEVRGLTQRLQKVVGRVYTAGCPWVFGSIGSAYVPACNIDLGPLTVTGTVTSAASLRDFTDSALAQPSDYFGAGLITMTSGENENVQMEVYSFDAGRFVLHLPLPYTVAVGDTYSVTPGCRKRFTEDCRNKWANTNNFGGFPQVPGSDKVLGLGGTEGTNL
ncbi:putative phage protein (TIGR02218 family) [Variovorax boronicumulans]|uniref:DUF2163 domain-containing protein n=1 Tax=Variovorax boronicumulans TaxID=436515 RepID=UPI002786CFE5|nr:DUF2163 domain-containing protein [Variovorax boronicumulans]MDP9991960.1 putative phage protein (TIGR02218 family) [Variovorax boronicumulans]MDQ0001855.1 putative phage protein (TIGR02218 family) [Variovorax boronicumulans]